MPSLFAAFMTVLPCGTCTARPSTSMFKSFASDIRWDDALLVRDVMLELAAEMLDEALDRQCGRVSERADRPALDVVRDLRQQIEILGAALAVLDAVHHAPQPPGAFAARCALAARLLVIEIRQPQQALHHAPRVVQHDDRARAEHRAGLRDRV